MRKDKWCVYGEYGGYFTNLKEAKLCAKEASKCEEYDYECEVYLFESGCWYFQYQNGKLVYDGWTRKKVR